MVFHGSHTNYEFLILVIRRATRGGGGRPPLPFLENQRKCPDFAKKDPDWVHP